MKDFYKTLAAAAKEDNVESNWLAAIRKATLEQIRKLQEGAAEWATW